jgi:hypothetical protein
MRSTAEIADALVQILSGISWQGESAFGVVARYDATRLPEAFGELRMATHPRVALVIWTGERWEADPNFIKRQRRTNLFTLVISDRVLGDRTGAAMWGQQGTHPGAAALKDLVLPLIVARLLANPDPADCVVTAVEPLPLMDEQDSAAAVDRVAITIDLEILSGWIDFPTYRSPVLGRD